MKVITFIDGIGRTLIGEELELTSTSLKLKNPAMINVAQAQNGQLQVQLIPLFFSEFIEESKRSEGSVWTYNTANIVLGEVSVDTRLLEQYTRVVTVTAPTQPQSTDQPVIKLFDE
jgi:hypothetical protein